MGIPVRCTRHRLRLPSSNGRVGRVTLLNRSHPPRRRDFIGRYFIVGGEVWVLTMDRRKKFGNNFENFVSFRFVEISWRGGVLIEKIKSGGDCFEEKGRKRGRKDGEGSRGIVAFISRFLRATASTIQLASVLRAAIVHRIAS